MPRSLLPAPVRVRVPATSANLGPGFDSLAVALDWHDTVTARVTEGGLEVEVVGVGGEDSHTPLPRDEDHLVVRSMRAAFAALGAGPDGLAVSCHNDIPHGRGLGSSAAAIVAGIVAARSLVRDGEERLPMPATLALAGRLEGHPDNVAAALLGGLTVAWRDDGVARATRLEPSPDVSVVVFVPEEGLPTEQARALLPESVPHGDAAANAARSALLVAGLTESPRLLLPATQDRLHQPYRAAAMPESGRLVESLRAAGVPAVLSGAGPSVLAFVVDGPDEDSAGGSADRVGGHCPSGWQTRHLALDLVGARAGPV